MDAHFSAETDLGPQLTDIALSDTHPLPALQQHIVLDNPEFLAKSFHSQVYAIDLTDRNHTTRVILKLFPKGLKKRYTKEVNAYRFLQHYGVPEKGLVPKVFGVIPTINKQRLGQLLQDENPDPIPVPASAIVMEFIHGVRPSEDNMTHTMATKIVHALDAIHAAHVLHGDVEPRNILIDLKTEAAVWIDFSAAEINRLVFETTLERQLIKQTLYRTLMGICELDTDDSYSPTRDGPPRGEAIEPPVLAEDAYPFGELAQESRAQSLKQTVESTQSPLVLYSFIIATFLNGLAHILLPRTIMSSLIRYTESTYMRSHGIASVPLVFLTLGMKQALQGDVALQSVLLASVTIYCGSNLSILALSTVTSDGGGVLDCFGWVNCFFYIFWLLGLVHLQRRDIMLIRNFV